jgi:hypothetical protein
MTKPHDVCRYRGRGSDVVRGNRTARECSTYNVTLNSEAWFDGLYGIKGKRGSRGSVAIKALGYKPEGREFQTR